MTDLNSLGSLSMTPSRGTSREERSETVSDDGPVCRCGQTTGFIVIAGPHGISSPQPSCMDCDSADKPVRPPFFPFASVTPAAVARSIGSGAPSLDPNEFDASLASSEARKGVPPRLDRSALACAARSLWMAALSVRENCALIAKSSAAFPNRTHSSISAEA